ncbi:MAG: hypothetical protein GY739_21685 [Mesoflavibacter sp.]|nr:hypothetical protein [Mesoflavibacter sp.]
MLIDIEWIQRYLIELRENYEILWDIDHNIEKSYLLNKIEEHKQIVEETQHYTHVNLWTIGTKSRILKLAGLMIEVNSIHHRLTYIQKEIKRNFRHSHLSTQRLEKIENLISEVKEEQENTDRTLRTILDMFQMHNTDEQRIFTENETDIE